MDSRQCPDVSGRRKELTSTVRVPSTTDGSGSHPVRRSSTNSSSPSSPSIRTQTSPTGLGPAWMSTPGAWTSDGTASRSPSRIETTPDG